MLPEVCLLEVRRMTEDLDTWWQGATVVAEVHEHGVCMDGY